MKTYRQIIIVLLLYGLWGCSAIQPKPVEMPAVEGGLPDGQGWWSARFRVARPEGEAPRWHIGTLLAGEVIAPVFDTHYRDIMIWRVHRRAGNDDHGHVFSFIFYGTPDGAQRVYKDIADNPVLARLRQEQKISWVGFDDLHTITRPDIEDTSDSNWSVPVQKTWPALIMGASRMWLDLVGELAAAHTDEPDLERRYEIVQQELNGIWAGQGQHAMLHHLSAIFAYEPLLIKY
ncbi:MAG: hypothetical protein OEU91_01465 [Gammaproteobacteria bacterium]|nr:hypothetical protein [Gammaproteobacteria bacterium]